MKKLLPALLALLGLGAGVGAGLVLKAPPEETADAACPEGGAGGHGADAACGEADPFTPAPGHGPKPGKAQEVVALDKPFVVPVFRGDKVVAMVVASVAVAIDAEAAPAVEAAQPRLRDGVLAAMFRHANSGGFDGAFTTGRRMEDLRAALVVAARQVFEGHEVSDVLITEIARQDL